MTNDPSEAFELVDHAASGHRRGYALVDGTPAADVWRVLRPLYLPSSQVVAEYGVTREEYVRELVETQIATWCVIEVLTVSITNMRTYATSWDDVAGHQAGQLSGQVVELMTDRFPQLRDVPTARATRIVTVELDGGGTTEGGNGEST